MAKFYFSSVFTATGVAKTFNSLAAGLYKLGRENLLDGEILNSKAGFDMQDYPLTIVGTGAMTVSSLVVRHARYALLGKLLYVKLRAQFTTGGVAAASVKVSLPRIPGAVPRDPADVASVGLFDGGVWDPGLGFIFGTDAFSVYKIAGAAWGIGAAREIRGNFWIEMRRDV